MLDNIILKLETASTEYNGVILCIAGIKFSASTDETESFIVYIEPKSSINLKLEFNIITLDWIRQNRPLIWSECKKGKSLQEAISMLNDFIGTTTPDIEVWGNGTDFIIPMLKSSFKAVGVDVPWKFYNVRDLRTIAALLDRTVATSCDSFDPLEICHRQLTLLKNIFQR